MATPVKPKASVPALKKDTPLAEITERPDFMKSSSHRGSEGVRSSDLTIPRLEMLQDLSPQLKQTDPLYNPDAEVGDIINSVTKKLMGKSVTIVPVYFRKEYIIWKSRKAGGGFEGAYPTELEAAKALIGILDRDGMKANEMMVGKEKIAKYEINDTAQHFCLLILPETTAENPVVEEVVISMSKSKMKASRQLNTMVQMAGGDRFSRLYTLATTLENNKNGDEYQNWVVTQRGFVPESLFRRAEATYEAVKGGVRDVDRRQDGEAELESEM